MTDIREAQFVARASSGALARRPVSPHIGIYRWPVTMAASILNRATGIALSAGALFMVVWLAAAASGPQAFDAVQSFLGSAVGLFMLLGWTASLYYHLFNGLRHLNWDMGHGFAKPSLNLITWAIFGLSALATLITWVAGYAMLEG